MKRDDVIQVLRQHRSELSERFHVRSLGLFGSVARGEAGDTSDVDLLVEFSEPPGFDGYMNLKFRLEELLRGKGFLLSRRYYEFVGKKGTYTRKRGLDREQNLALLLNHIRANADSGCKLEELCDVLPALPKTSVRSLVRTLQRRGQSHFAGVGSGARWFPGPEPSRDAGNPAGQDGAD